MWSALLAVSAVARSSTAAEPEQPNIVFIMADDLGWRDLSCFGSTFHQTPHVDELATLGVKFTQAYAANPLCSPTRSSVLTGLWPARTGITAPVCHLPEVILEKGVQPAGGNARMRVAKSVTRLKTDYVTLPEILRQAGYRTAHFGKWHLGPEPYSALEQGFEVDFPHWPGPGPAGSYVAPWKFPPTMDVKSVPGEHIEDRVSEQIVKYIGEHKDEPFFINYWQFSVHAPYDAKPEVVEHYRPLADDHNPQHNPLYAAMVHSLDEGVGRVVAAIRQHGLLEKTIFVYFSDNGGVNWQALKPKDKSAAPPLAAPFAEIPPTSNSPLRAGKASVYEGGVREPCIVVWPGVVQPGTTNDTIIQSIDWLPTLLEMAHVPLPPAVQPDGVSIVPALKGLTDTVHDAIYCHFPHSVPANNQPAAVTVRCGDWKLHRIFAGNDDGSDQLELYNLHDDLGETTNVVAQHAELATELNAKISQFLAETEAVIPLLNTKSEKRK